MDESSSVCVCVFTAVFGGYESLNRQPPARRLTDRWLCFTYDPRLASDDWEIVVVEPDFLLDPQRSARQIKMLGHPLVREYERSLWIDNSVVLDQPPNVIVDEWLRSADLAFCVHSFRESVLDEFLAVLDDSLDDRSRVLEQLDHYARSMPEVLDARPLWAAVIARRWTPDVERTMETWWKHVLRYSRRDQLSLIAALETTGLAVERVEVDNHRSPWHQWPIIPDRDTAMRHVTTQDLPRPPMAELRVSQRRLAEAHNRIVELSSATAEIEEERRRLEEELQRSEEERRRLEEQLACLPSGSPRSKLGPHSWTSCTPSGRWKRSIFARAPIRSRTSVIRCPQRSISCCSSGRIFADNSMRLGRLAVGGWREDFLGRCVLPVPLEREYVERECCSRYLDSTLVSPADPAAPSSWFQIDVCAAVSKLAYRCPSSASDGCDIMRSNALAQSWSERVLAALRGAASTTLPVRD